MGKLEGKIALITGGNSGIGLATAKQFVDEGAYVFITGRRDPELAAAVKEIGRNVTGAQGDVANLGDLDRLFAQIKREKGKLDIVFANAGAARSPTIHDSSRALSRQYGFRRRSLWRAS
jgi:NAD(P)-dependent dehydrogenase (short-subunit alcohol dehydrogenase family)